jgi:plasmid maintenance system antidote protein VapI
MKRSIEFLKEAKEKLGCESDYALAKALKTSHANISNYVNGKTLMDDYHCIRVAQVLGIDPMKIIAAAQEEREKNPEKQGFWRDFRQEREKQGGRTLVPIMAALGGLMMMTMLAAPAVDTAMQYKQNIIYYVKLAIVIGAP